MKFLTLIIKNLLPAVIIVFLSSTVFSASARRIDQSEFKADHAERLKKQVKLIHVERIRRSASAIQVQNSKVENTAEAGTTRRTSILKTGLYLNIGMLIVVLIIIVWARRAYPAPAEKAS